VKSSLRYFYILILIGLQLLTLLAILASSRSKMEAILQDHASAVMDHLSDTIADNTLRYLAPAERAAQLTEALLKANSINLFDTKALETYFLNQLQANPEMTGIYVGQPNGDFLFVKRDQGGFLTKIIRAGPVRKVRYRHHSATFEFINETLEPSDAYNPRERPWYQEALKQRQQIWTDPYVFFTSKRPGITVARPVYTGQALIGIVGVDVELTGLAAFLEKVPLSSSGSAFLMNHDGVAIAFPGIEKTISQDAEKPTLPQVSEAANNAAQSLLEQFSNQQIKQLETREFKSFALNGATQYGILSPFKFGDAVWVTGIYAPAADFQGQIQTQYQQYRKQIIVIAILMGLLAIPFVFGVTRPMLRLYEQATRDELTQLPNRAEFLKQAKRLVTQAQRKGQNIAVAMVDLDGFKNVNDTYGHKAGDEVLSIIGRRLSAIVRSGDLVGRLGGDEFALVLLGVNDTEATQLVERIRTNISHEPVQSDDDVYTVGATAGVAMNRYGENLLESLAKADQALLDAKSTGKNCTLAFSS
jgi:diguanylate cyclase (GGDEF)-like protein